MKVSDAIEALKAFFLDIIGYFIPGFFAIIVLGFSIQTNWKYDSNNIGIGSEWQAFLIIFFSYILGYVIYSMSELTDSLLAKLKILKVKKLDDIEREIGKGHEIEITRVALKELFIKKDNTPAFDAAKLDNLRVRDLRNIVMSYVPESDTKIYTFMFRAELCKNLGSFSILFASFAMLLSAYNIFMPNDIIVESGIQHIVSYILLLICSYFFIKTKNRFLSIAYRIPFAIFLSKYFAIK